MLGGASRKNRASVREGIKALFGVRRGFDKIEEEAGLSWQQEHRLLHTTARTCRHTIPGPRPRVGQHRRGAKG
jgi:hypothetical protein